MADDERSARIFDELAEIKDLLSEIQLRSQSGRVSTAVDSSVIANDETDLGFANSSFGADQTWLKCRQTRKIRVYGNVRVLVYAMDSGAELEIKWFDRRCKEIDDETLDDNDRLSKCVKNAYYVQIHAQNGDAYGKIVPCTAK